MIISDERAFGENYWVVPDRSGNRRIDRKADPIIELVRRLVYINVLPENPLCVDVGAGPGNMVRDFRVAGFDCEGCEFSESGRRLAMEHFGITLPYCDLRESIPFRDGQFDFMYCVGVMTMIPREHVPTAFREMHRTLRRGGILHINLVNPKLVENEPHLTNMAYTEWLGLLKGAGFEDVTSLWPPQRHGIGVNNEFCGIFRT